MPGFQLDRHASTERFFKRLSSDFFSDPFTRNREQRGYGVVQVQLPLVVSFARIRTDSVMSHTTAP
ncbi:MAG: hypothetical protein JW820_18770 [Spirochaetales bacterium]|nr:hypothetical protein [Spirochaetales bacterium]